MRLWYAEGEIMKFKRIFEPITIKNLVLKNRIVMPAIHLGYTKDGYINDKIKSFYFERAEGGVGLITIGGCKFDRFGGTIGMPDIGHDKYMEGFKELTEGLHKRSSKVAIQLYHSGGYNKKSFLDDELEPIAPSSIYNPYSRETPREIKKEEIIYLIDKYAKAAKRSKKVGFDAVEISGSAGYLICQFLSPLRNQRNDEYGGSWENRTRFVKELVLNIREAVGVEYPLIMRISGNDFVKGSNSLEDSKLLGKMLERLGIDIINVTGGWHETVIPQISGDVERGGYRYLSKAIKEVVNIPVMASNRINDPYVAEKILALDNADLINVGRGMIADPHWCNKAKQNREDEIKHCIACNQKCLSRVFFGKPAECLVNPSAGNEHKKSERKEVKQKKILVVGAGPAGCEFAVTAASLGHNVELWEKSSSIGGQLKMASKTHGKREFSTLIDYYERMLKKHQVDLKLLKEANVKEIRKNSYDEIVIAVGNLSRKIELEILDDSVKIFTPAEVLLEDKITGKNVVVLGGGSVGCEVAEYLARDAALSEEQLYFLMANRAEKTDKIFSLLDNSDRDVSIVEIDDKIGKGFEPGTAWPLLKNIKRLKVKKYVNSKAVKIENNKVIIKELSGDRELKIKSDSVINATGYAPNNMLYKQLSKEIDSVHNIGDSVKIGKISDAIKQGNELAYKI